MSGVSVTIKSAGLDRALKALGNLGELGKEASAIGLNQLFRDHFAALQNQRGRSGGTGFYAKASDSVFHRITPEGIWVGSRQIGLRQRLHGGTIRPKRAKYLTIPIHPDAYGKRAGDSSMDLSFIRTGSGVALLAATGENGYFVPYYLLLKSVTQKADPGVIPTKEKIFKTTHAGLKQALNHIKRSN